MTVLALDLPAPLADITPAAHLDRGRRTITWTVTDPGELHRNTYAMAWIEVYESAPWRGEPLWLSASRRRDESWSREPFTDRARDALHTAIVPQLARCFADLWLDLHRTRATPSDRRTLVGRAIASWCEQADHLAEMHALGLLEFRPVTPDEVRERFGRCGVGVPIWDEHQGVRIEDAVAWAVLDGEHVGWMLRTGWVVPLADPLGRAR